MPDDTTRRLDPVASALSGVRRQDGRFTFTVSDDWLQGRTTFGALLAAFGLRAIRDLIGSDRPLRSVQVVFAGPVGRGMVSADARLVREGRSVTLAHASVGQGEAPGCFVTATCGAPRRSDLPRLAAARPISLPSPDRAPEVPFVPGVTPSCVQHFELRWALGDTPLSGGRAEEIGVYVRLKHGEADVETLALMVADVLPSPAQSAVRAPVVSSSVSWYVQCLPLPRGVATGGWWLNHTVLTALADGYAHQTSAVWTPSGELAVVAHQMMTVYA
ncbi:MAG: thioesterase family protein [Acidobacteria bacterium]|nr:thioesterase family protein [Acidobacteriota bacterium]